MLIRFVQVRTNDASPEALRQAYERSIIPALREMPGCLSAALLRSNSDAQECISMTTWRTAEDVQRYEQSGRFRELLDILRPYFADATEWRLELGADLTVKYEPVSNDPVVRRFDVAATARQSSAAHFTPDYVRVVSHRIREGSRGEFRRIYEQDILPILRTLEGCRRAYLVEDPNDETKMLSVTAWTSQRDAERYEQSGQFSTLLSKLEPTLSDLYQWKLNVGSGSRSHVSTSDDVAIDGYTMLVGQEFTS